MDTQTNEPLFTSTKSSCLVLEHQVDAFASNMCSYIVNRWQYTYENGRMYVCALVLMRKLAPTASITHSRLLAVFAIKLLINLFNFQMSCDRVRHDWSRAKSGTGNCFAGDNVSNAIQFDIYSKKSVSKRRSRHAMSK